MKRAIVLALLVACHPQPRHEQTGVTIDGIAAKRITPPISVAPAVAVIGGLHGPESVLYDPAQDVYFISNINGGELAVDGNGFISRVDAKTFATNLKWIDHLDGPKGMTILGDTLYVSDVTAVRRFDRRSGTPRGVIPIPGATFVNDLTNDGHSVYMSDTGLAMGPGTKFIRTGTEAIWKITGDRAEKIASGLDLKEPNGLEFVDGKLLVVSFGADQFYTLSGDGKMTDAVSLPEGELDGVVHLEDGTFLIASWKGDAIYRGARGGPFHPILQAIDAPADIGYDTKRHRLLIPRAFANEVTVHDVAERRRPAG